LSYIYNSSQRPCIIPAMCTWHWKYRVEWDLISDLKGVKVSQSSQAYREVILTQCGKRCKPQVNRMLFQRGQVPI
jgi:hypothetical protein